MSQSYRPDPPEYRPEQTGSYPAQSPTRAYEQDSGSNYGSGTNTGSAPVQPQSYNTVSGSTYGSAPSSQPTYGSAQQPTYGSAQGQAYGSAPMPASGSSPTQSYGSAPNQVPAVGSQGAIVPSQSASQGPERTLVSLPGIQVTNKFVHTPNGSIPLERAKWSMQNATMTTQTTPAWAIVLTIVLFFFIFLFSLFFLLAKENKVRGTLIVSVSGPGVSHTQHINVQSQYELTDLMSRYEYARSLS